VHIGRGGHAAIIQLNAGAQAADFIIREAMKDDPRPLYVLCQGALSNVAAAITNALLYTAADTLDPGRRGWQG
jgi:hypothetical protein